MKYLWLIPCFWLMSAPIYSQHTHIIPKYKIKIIKNTEISSTSNTFTGYLVALDDSTVHLSIGVNSQVYSIPVEQIRKIKIREQEILRKARIWGAVTGGVTFLFVGYHSLTDPPSQYGFDHPAIRAVAVIFTTGAAYTAGTAVRAIIGLCSSRTFLIWGYERKFNKIKHKLIKYQLSYSY